MLTTVQSGHVAVGKNTCSGCSSRWWGENVAHCATCHHTFTAPSTFDKHRRNGRCIRDLNSCGLSELREGVWGTSRDAEAS